MLTRECLPMDQIFTHIDPDTAEVRHFNASAIDRCLPRFLVEGKAEQVTVALDPAFVQYIRNHRGIEQRRMDTLTPQEAVKPVIGVRMPDDSVLLVDGHHRMVYLHEKIQAKTYEMYLVALGAWGAFLVEDMPHDLHEYAIGSLR